MTSFHNEIITKTCGGKGWCEKENRWKVCDWPNCGKKKKEGCGYLHPYQLRKEQDDGK